MMSRTQTSAACHITESGNRLGSPSRGRDGLTWPGTIAAAAIVVCGALVFLLTHGYATGWNWTKDLWDAGYYFQIASSGYRSGDGHVLAFLPGYPILLAPAARLLPQLPFLASFITSSILSTAGGTMLYRLLRRRLGTWTSLCGIALLAFSPFAIYLYNGYSEPAFLVCVVLTLAWLTDGYLLLAAFATGYAFLCRPYAVALLPLFLPAAWQLMRQRNFWKLGWIVLLGAAPALIYCAWMYHVFGDPLVAAKALNHWQQYESISASWPLPIRTMLAFHFTFRDSAPGTWPLSLIMYFLAASATLAAAGRLPGKLVVYSLLLLVCVYFTDALVPVNLGRHAMLAFAACPAIAAVLYGTKSDGAWASASRHGAFAVALLFFIATFIVTGNRFSLGLWVS